MRIKEGIFDFEPGTYYITHGMGPFGTLIYISYIETEEQYHKAVQENLKVELKEECPTPPPNSQAFLYV